jgi:hypothetical protein
LFNRTREAYWGGIMDGPINRKLIEWKSVY